MGFADHQQSPREGSRPHGKIVKAGFKRSRRDNQTIYTDRAAMAT